MTTLPRTLPLLLLAAMVLTSGCMGALVGDEPISASASEATIDETAVADAGYVHEDTQKLELNRTVEAAGQSRQVEVTNWVSMYTKSIEIEGVGHQQVAAVAVFSTPEVSVLGQSVNPISRMDDADLIERVISQGSNVNDVEKVGSSSVTVLGEETEVTKFSATITVDGQQVDGYVHLGRVTHEGDIVLVAGMYPQQLPDEESTVLELMGEVEH